MLNFKILRDMKLGIPVGEMVVLVAGKVAHSAINFDNKFVIDSEQENGKLELNEVDNQFEQQSFIIDIKGD